MYQKRVMMQYAFRVICSGMSLVAEKKGAQTIEPYALPEQLKANIRACMAQLGLVSAVFEFIKTPDDVCVFMNLTPYAQQDLLNIMWPHTSAS